MSKTTQTIIWVVAAVIVIGGGIWWWMASRQAALPFNPGGPMIPASSSTQSNANGTSPAVVSTGTSDSDLNQDMANINAQMDGLSSDSASVDASVASSSQ